MASITLAGVSKVYGNGQAAARDLTLEVADGELLVLVGPSGSGKSTVLRLLAGLEAPSSGRVLIGDRDVTERPPQERDVAMVFQSYALYPHKSVRDNLAFGLRVRGVDAATIAERVSRAALTLGLDGLLDRKPSQLSGGQRQRVALGRAIVREPQAFLLDEPLSNLDPLLRVGTRAEIALLHRRLRATMVYVTHDQEEAMTLGTRIAVMREGRIEQLAPPLVVYERPANNFVAQFIGSPAMNLWPCVWSRHGAVGRISAPGFALESDAWGDATADGGPVLLGVRPRDVEVVAPGGGDANGSVEIIEPLGFDTLVHVRLDGLSTLARVLVPSDQRIEMGGQIGIRLRRNRLHLFDGQTGGRLEQRGG
jgi:ABC-type sugar transport system ATPase subunit